MSPRSLPMMVFIFAVGRAHPATRGRESGQEEIDVKYMLMTFGDRSGLVGRSPEWITGMIEFMRSIDVELSDSGELVFQQGLANAPEAKTVRLNGGSPKVTDGPVALAGFWIVDVADEARAIAIAGRISEAAEAPIEVRACMDAPPPEVQQLANPAGGSA